MLDHKAEGFILLWNDEECINEELAIKVHVLLGSLVKVQKSMIYKEVLREERERGHTHFEVCMLLRMTLGCAYLGDI